jgi:Tol biopolymer transport system component
MRQAFDNVKRLSCLGILFCLSFNVIPSLETACGAQHTNESELRESPHDKSALDLKAIPFKIMYETYREMDGRGNWELFLMNADGSNATNLTQTSDVDEMYPHVSPDGTKVCFVTDEKRAKIKVRNVYYMNIDGTGRVKIADHARQPCWSPDSKTIAYLKDEYDRYTTRSYGTKGLFFYDIATVRHEQHPNRELLHAYNVCWSPEGKWFVASAVGGMGFGQVIVAFEAQGNAMFDLTKYGVKGCRPDIGPDGGKIGWAQRGEVDLCISDIDLTLSVPRVADIRSVIRCGEGYYVNQMDFSPDGRYIAFSYGPPVDYSVGVKAPGWNICVSDLSGKWVQITADGKSNKEPDWVPIGKKDAVVLKQ